MSGENSLLTAAYSRSFAYCQAIMKIQVEFMFNLNKHVLILLKKKF